MGFIAAQGNATPAGLGDYFDGTNTWHYDAASGQYVDQNGNPSGGTTTTTQTAAPPNDPLAGQYGSTPNAQGGYTYDPANNPYLQTAPTNTSTAGVTQAMNPNFYATYDAAAQFAAALGGQVVLDPKMQIGGTGSPIYAVQLPDGTTANAGAIAQILGNDAAFGNAAVKSGEIAKLFGASYDPGIAEAIVSGGTVQLAPGPVAPGYNPTPLSQSYQPTKTTTSTQTTTPTYQPAPKPASPITNQTAPTPASNTTAGGSGSSGTEIDWGGLNIPLSQYAEKAKETAAAALGDNWALWLAAAVAAYLLLRRQQEA